MVNKWDKHFIEEAIHWSKLSHDIHTKCGAVMVDSDNTIISAGYNGFIRGIEDGDLPLSRPEKYPYMIHAEANCLYNAARQNKVIKGSKMYITSKPCITCLQAMWQCGVAHIVYSDYSIPQMCEEEKSTYRVLAKKMGGNIIIDFIPYGDLL